MTDTETFCGPVRSAVSVATAGGYLRITDMKRLVEALPPEAVSGRRYEKCQIAIVDRRGQERKSRQVIMQHLPTKLTADVGDPPQGAILGDLGPGRRLLKQVAP